MSDTQEEEEKNKDKKKKNLIIGLSITASILLFLLVIYFVWRNKKESKRRFINRINFAKVNQPLNKRVKNGEISESSLRKIEEEFATKN
jgi:flagellar basal body-associated protein FliL